MLTVSGCRCDEGTIDILAEFEAEEEGGALQNLKFYIIDSHRPVILTHPSRDHHRPKSRLVYPTDIRMCACPPQIDLSNAYDSDRVIVFDDGQTERAIPSPEEVWNMSDDEDEVDDDGVPKRRRKDGQQDVTLSPRSRRLAREERDIRREEYYSATSFGAAASVIMWQLVGDIGKTDNHLLWLSIVGLTDQFVQERIDSSAYVQGFDRLADDVRRMNAIDEEGADDKVQVRDQIQIKAEEELRFMLLRHWNLMDAMSHSRYVATRLGIWRQSGKQDLRNLLAKMGISIEQCKQQFSSMDVRLRSQLFDQIGRYAHLYNLENCVFPSFVSRTGFRAQYSASDLVYATTGLLEAAGETPEEPVDWRKNFFDAFDALGMVGDRKEASQRLLRRGAENSMRQHAALLRQVESIVEGKNNIHKKANAFRYVFIKDDPDQKYFIHHPTLRRLGLYLLDTFRFSKSKDKGKKRSLPLVLAALNPANETYVVAGVWSTLHRSEGQVSLNEFGKHFQRAGERAEARIRMAAFDTSVLEVKSDDMQVSR